jgi:hypothetical protein
MRRLLCRFGIHTSVFGDTMGINAGTDGMPIWLLDTTYRCNHCGEKTT